jgi:CDGSH-type Zn-finger protein
VEDPDGVIELTDLAGKRIDLSGKPTIALCRCGASVNKPFCDGTHSKIGFQAAEAAVAAEKPKP